MLHTRYASVLRRRMIEAMGEDARQAAEARRSDANPFSEGEYTPIGTLHGYRYRLRNAQTALMLGIPGELAGGLDSEWFMDLTPGLPVAIQPGDTLAFTNGDTRSVSIVRGSGQFSGHDIYRLYKLEEV